MKYQKPYNETNSNASYVNPDPATGLRGSVPCAEAVEHPMREIVNVITGAGLTPSATDLTQLYRAAKTIAEREAQAVAANNLAAMNTVATNIATSIATNIVNSTVNGKALFKDMSNLTEANARRIHGNRIWVSAPAPYPVNGTYADYNVILNHGIPNLDPLMCQAEVFLKVARIADTWGYPLGSYIPPENWKITPSGPGTANLEQGSGPFLTSTQIGFNFHGILSVYRNCGGSPSSNLFTDRFDYVFRIIY